MPAAFVYLVAVFLLAAVAFLLLASALLMALVPKLRSRAKSIALGVPGSAVGLVTFQLVAFPIVLAILWTFLAPVAYFHGSGGVTTNPLIILLSIGSILIATAFFGTASLGGLVVGWRAANAVGEGIPLRAFLASDEIWQVVSTVFRRPYRMPFLLWLLCVWSAFGISGARCWLNSGATVAEVPGAYRTRTSQGLAMLDIGADGSWEYRVEAQSEPLWAGKWAFEAEQSDGSTVAITFKGARSGLQRMQTRPGVASEEFPPTSRGYVFSYVSRDCAGRLQVCFGADDQICYERLSEKGH